MLLHSGKLATPSGHTGEGRAFTGIKYSFNLNTRCNNTVDSFKKNKVGSDPTVSSLGVGLFFSFFYLKLGDTQRGPERT